MCLQRKTICDECKKDTDGLMTCYPNDTTIKLCPDCLAKNGTYCMGCGVIEDADYCDECLDSFDDDFWGDDEWDEEDRYDHEYDDEDFPNGSLDY